MLGEYLGKRIHQALEPVLAHGGYTVRTSGREEKWGSGSRPEKQCNAWKPREGGVSPARGDPCMWAWAMSRASPRRRSTLQGSPRSASRDLLVAWTKTRTSNLPTVM
jgi:hypothetical protein